MSSELHPRRMPRKVESRRSHRQYGYNLFKLKRTEITKLCLSCGHWYRYDNFYLAKSTGTAVRSQCVYCWDKYNGKNPNNARATIAASDIQSFVE